MSILSQRFCVRVVCVCVYMVTMQGLYMVTLHGLCVVALHGLCGSSVWSQLRLIIIYTANSNVYRFSRSRSLVSLFFIEGFFYNGSEDNLIRSVTEDLKQ